MKKIEVWNLVGEKSEFLFGLWDRWQEEQEYEDIQDYLTAIQKHFPVACEITANPFAFVCKCDDGAIKIVIGETDITAERVTSTVA